ncbi:hypothetical protein EJ06DRAFT_580647 [Trichodelitschia bisporula]|uniref:CwfJ domain-containing protein n=1 Tax=Trichodelitschia bisporula TaxID=703511 RepID=A0A6G1I2H0_9PEZI|nr:hypothetical protein EJ06DRAFT_580647 [Trichodelitschia bisporula]
MSAAKIVAIGDVNGQLESLFQKLGTLHAKNAFSFALITGNLFSDPTSASSEETASIQRLIDGTISVPLTTYFALGSHPLPPTVIDKLDSSEGELCPNLFFLGKRTTTKTSDGIKLVALGGTHDPALDSLSKDSYAPTYSETDARSLRGANAADILVTTDWPIDIRKGSQAPYASDSSPTGHPSIADLAIALKPRYHFSPSNAFYEREPFAHPSSEANPDTFAITRFISLAPFANPDKQKWIYAFTLDPTAAAPITLPSSTTSSPLSSSRKRPLPEQQSYRFANPATSAGYRGGPKRRRAPPPSQSECFFCLSNPSIATHLITSIGSESYLTTAKGPLPPKDSTSLPFPGHMLIIPLAHSPTIPSLPSDTVAEMTRYRHAVHALLKSRAPRTAAVTFALDRAAGVHAHWQFIPIPADLVTKGLVSAAFKVEAENEGHGAVVAGPPGADAEGADVFRVWVWDPATGDEKEQHLVLDDRFRDLQFGRRVLAKLLGVEGRADWRACGQSVDEETADAEAFKEAFAEFDFTNEE